MRLLIAVALIAGCEKKQAAPRPAAAQTLPSECDEYRRAVEALASCEKMPPQSIAALKEGFAIMSEGWRDVGSYPPEAVKAMAEGCKQGVLGIQQATKGLCGAEANVAPEQPVDASNLPSECQDYRRAIDGLAKCEKFPQQSIDALKQSFDAMSDGWGDSRSVSAAARTALADGCRAGTDAVKQAMSAVCGVEQMSIPATATDLPRECEEYQRLTAAVVACEKLSADVRKAIKLAFDQLAQRWSGDHSLPPAARQALGESCKAASATVRDIAANTCDLP